MSGGFPSFYNPATSKHSQISSFQVFSFLYAPLHFSVQICSFINEVSLLKSGMLLKSIARLQTSLPLYLVPIHSFVFSISRSSAPTPKRFNISLMNLNKMSTSRDQGLNSFQIQAIERYSCLRNGFWKHCIIQLLKRGADVTFRQTKLALLEQLRFNIKQNRFTTFQSFNEYIITPKSEVELDKRLNEENKLSQQQAVAYIKKVRYENPKSEQYDGPLEMYSVHKLKNASISKNLKNLFAKCDQHPGEYCIAASREISDYELIDFIIAKKQLFTYYIFTFDASILMKKQKLSDSKALFADILSRQTCKPNYIINHVALCHRDVEQSMPYDPQKNFNIFYSPWDELTFRKSNNSMFLKVFNTVREVINKKNDTLTFFEEIRK